MKPVSRRPLDLLGVAIVMVVCMSLGAQQAAMKAIADYMSPTLQLAVRSAVAAAVIAAFMAWRRGGPTLHDRHWGPGLAAGGLFAAEFVALSKGLTLTSASHMVVFLYTAPIFTAVGLHLTLPEERLSARGWVGVSSAFLGVAVAFFDLNAEADVGGDLLGLAAGACLGATTVLIRLSSLAEAAPEKTLLYQLTVCAVVLAGASVATGDAQPLDMPLGAWGVLAFQVFGISLATYLTWFWLLRRYPAGRISTMSFLTPLFGVFISALWLAEPLKPRFLAGSALVALGILCVTWRVRSRDARSP